MRSSTICVQRLEDRLPPAILTVNSLLDNTTSGDGFVTLREAIIAANNDTTTDSGDIASGADVIIFASALSGKTITLNGTQLPTISSAVTIDGPGSELLTIDGDESSRILEIGTGGIVTISKVTITRGSVTGDGGGVSINNGELNINDSILSFNKASGGGGAIYNNSGSLMITNTNLSNNQATFDGGAIFNINDGKPTILRSTLGNNQAGGGGGAIYNNSGALSITDSTISGNKATFDGGAIFNINDAAPIIQQSAIYNNEAGGGGGGVYIAGGSLTILNTTLSNLKASFDGGAIFNMGGSLFVANSTIVFNQADSDVNGQGEGGGLYNGGKAVLFNSMIAGNRIGITHDDDINGNKSVQSGSAGNLIGSASSSGGLSHSSSNIVGNNGSGTLSLNSIIDPVLANNGGNTMSHALVAGSIAINRGFHVLAIDQELNRLTTDQRGFARIVHENVDIGAIEWSESPPTIKSAIPDRTFIEDAANFVIDLTNHFTDTLDGGTGLTYTITANTNGQLLTTTISKATLTLDFIANATGSTTITVRATDSNNTSITDTFTINVTPVNDAPVLNTSPAPTLPTIPEDSTTHSGINITTLLGNALTDVDSNALKGIAIISVNGTGTWQYRLNVNAAWTSFVPSATAARLLPSTAFVRFLPAANFNGTATITYRGWDQTTGSAGGTANLSTFSSVGGATAFSTASETASITISPVNDAPILNTAPTPRFPNVPRNSTNPTGTTVAALLGNAVTDPDAAAKRGIAVLGLTGTTSGTWQYSLNGGSTWVNFNTVTTTTARLLRDTDRIRFVPRTNFTGTVNIQYRAWDQTSGSAGNTANISAASSVGGRTAFSLGVETASLTVG